MLSTHVEKSFGQKYLHKMLMFYVCSAFVRKAIKKFHIFPSLKLLICFSLGIDQALITKFIYFFDFPMLSSREKLVSVWCLITLIDFTTKLFFISKTFGVILTSLLFSLFFCGNLWLHNLSQGGGERTSSRFLPCVTSVPM